MTVPMLPNLPKQGGWLNELPNIAGSLYGGAKAERERQAAAALAKALQDQKIAESQSQIEHAGDPLEIANQNRTAARFAAQKRDADERKQRADVALQQQLDDLRQLGITPSDFNAFGDLEPDERAFGVESARKRQNEIEAHASGDPLTRGDEPSGLVPFVGKSGKSIMFNVGRNPAKMTDDRTRDIADKNYGLREQNAEDRNVNRVQTYYNQRAKPQQEALNAYKTVMNDLDSNSSLSLPTSVGRLAQLATPNNAREASVLMNKLSNSSFFGQPFTTLENLQNALLKIVVPSGQTMSEMTKGEIRRAANAIMAAHAFARKQNTESAVKYGQKLHVNLPAEYFETPDESEEWDKIEQFAAQQRQSIAPQTIQGAKPILPELDPNKAGG